jgi:hypothetical protein
MRGSSDFAFECPLAKEESASARISVNIGPVAREDEFVVDENGRPAVAPHRFVLEFRILPDNFLAVERGFRVSRKILRKKIGT